MPAAPNSRVIVVYMDEMRVGLVASFAATVGGVGVDEAWEIAREVTNTDLQAACSEAADIAYKRQWANGVGPVN